MSPVLSVPRVWLPEERRARMERRHARDRRRTLTTVVVERRSSPRPRRSPVDRRESPVGHIRNALQVLRELAATVPLDAEQQERLESLERRLWLALAEVEPLGIRPAPVSAPNRSAAVFR